MTSRDGYKLPFPVLVPCTPEEIEAGKIDGRANFDPVKPRTPVRLFRYVRGTPEADAVRKTMGSDWDLYIAANELRDAHESDDVSEEYRAEAIDLAFRKLLEALAAPGGTSANLLRSALTANGMTREKALALFTFAPSDKQEAEMREELANFWAQPEWSARTSPMNLPPVFALALRTAKLEIWWNEHLRRLQAVIFCPDHSTAMWARAALRDLLVCPGCDSPFVPTAPDQEHCSKRCRNRLAKRRERARKQSAA